MKVEKMVRTSGYGLLYIAHHDQRPKSWREFWTTAFLVPSSCKRLKAVQLPSGMQPGGPRAYDWRVQNSCITSMHMGFPVSPLTHAAHMQH